MIDTFFIDEKIKSRGKEYFNSDKVKLVFQGLNSFKTIVSGSKKYICELKLKDGELINFRCTCPYLKGACKHIAATILFYNNIISNQTIRSYEDLTTAINLKLQKQSLSNINLEITKSNISFVFNNIEFFNDLEVSKSLFFLLSNQIKYLDKQNIVPYYKIFIESLIAQNTSGKIIESLINLIINNKIIFQNTIFDLIEIFLSNNSYSNYALSAIKSYMVSYGCDHFITRFITTALIKDLTLNEELYLLIVSTPELISHNIRNVINNCINCDYVEPLKKLTIAYRDIVEKSALLRILNYFKSKGETTALKTLIDYLLKKYHNFETYLEYCSIYNKETRISNISQLLAFGKKYKFDISIKIFEGLPVKPGEISKISTDDLLLLKDNIPSDLFDAVSDTLSKRITISLERNEIDLSFTLLETLSYFNKSYYKQILFSNQVLNKISLTQYRLQFLNLLSKTDTLQDFGIFNYEVE